jgi:hypothetical protein
MNALVWFVNGAETLVSRMEQANSVLRQAYAQAEAGPLMLMVRRANMELSIAANRENRKAGRTEGRFMLDGAGQGFRRRSGLLRHRA